MKRLLMTGLVCAAMGACSGAAQRGTETAGATTGTDMAARYAECWALFSAKDWAAFATCYSPDATSELVDSGMPAAKGPQAILEEHSKPVTVAFPDVKGDLQLTLMNGHNGVTVALLTGTHTGPLETPAGEIPPTQKPIGMLVAHAVQFSEDGKAVDKEWFYQDVGLLLSQLGVVKGPARPVMTEGWAQKEVVIAKDDETERRNLAAIEKSVESFNKHDLAAMEAEAADDLVWSEIGVPVDWNKQQAVQSHAELFKAFSDLKITPTTTWAAGDYVVQQGVFAGTNDGEAPSMGLAKKTGKKLSLNYLQIYKLNAEGKISRSWGFWNGAAFAQQLGLI